MKYNRLTALLCCITGLLMAQDIPEVKYGKVSMEDFQQNYSSIDSSAEAIILYESGDVDFGYGDGYFKMIYNYHVRYKVLKKSGTDRAIFKIPIYKFNHQKTEMLTRLEGCTYNCENGKVIHTKLTKASIFHENPVDNVYQEKITLPNVKEGSIFELKYEIETPYSVRVNPRVWYFQRDIPVLWSKYTLLIPHEVTYRHLVGGYLRLLVNKEESSVGNLSRGIEGRAQAYTFVMKDAPAFHNEKFITSEKDYISKVSFEVIRASVIGDVVRNFSDTWESVVKLTLKEAVLGEALHQKRFLKDIIQELQPIKDTQQKVNAAFEYISKNIKWDKANAILPKTDLGKVFENKKGNAAEINIMLINLLRELGVDANPVILSTRGNGEINELFPMIDQFNFLIAHVTLNGKDLLMDATEPLSRPGMLPERCLNGTGRLINEKASRFVSLAPVQKRASFEMVSANIDLKSGTITGNVSLSGDGYDAYENRMMIREKGEEGFIKEMKQINSEWQLSNFKIENATRPAEILKVSYDFESPDNTSGEIIYLNPMFMSRIEENPFKENKRIYPVDLEIRSDHTYKATVKIPVGYQVAELPESANIMLPENLGKFSYAIAKTGDAISVSSRITMNEYYFTAEEYALLKNFYDEIIKKHAAQVVLKKA